MKRLLIIPDVHRPYHDEEAWRCMLAAAADFRPDRIVVLGDFADLYSVSDHDKDPSRAARVLEEIEAVKRGLDDLDALGATEKDFVQGNHEHRWDRFLASTVVLHGLGGVRFQDIVELGDRGWRWHPYGEHFKIGNLNVTHDADFCGKYAIHQTAAAFEGSVAFGHTHAMGVYYFGNAAGDTHVAASFGWLGSAVRADYLKAVKKARAWTLGFGVGYQFPDGRVFLQAVPIVGYNCVLNGKVYGRAVMGGKRRIQAEVGRQEIVKEALGNCGVCSGAATHIARRGPYTVRLCSKHAANLRKLSAKDRDYRLKKWCGQP